MNAIERALAILLLLTGGQRSATDLSQRFGVSVRTVYRDIDRLISLGIPVEAERGAEGGYRLARDFLQPPVALTRSETASLLVALALVRGLKATPLLDDLDSAQAKLLASLPRGARELFAQGERIVAIERPPPDVFHVEPEARGAGNMQDAVDVFLTGLLDGRRVRLSHENPYRARIVAFDLEPHGILFDRDRWYLYGFEVDLAAPRFLRADRVASIEVSGFRFRPRRDMTVQSQIGRAWLSQAMRRWEGEGRVSEIRVTRAQAELLARDWYYRHATVQADPSSDTRDGGAIVCVPTTDATVILPLVRWLGPGAEILTPANLRDQQRDEILQMARHLWPADERQPTK